MAVRIGKPAPEFEGEAWTRGGHGPPHEHQRIGCRAQRQRNAAGVTSAAYRRTMSRRLETRSIDANNLRRMAGKSVTAFVKTGVGRCNEKVADDQILCRSDGI